MLAVLNKCQIDRSPLHERRCRQRRQRRRRWKLSNFFRCTSAVRDEDIPSSRDAPPTYSSIFTDSLSHEFTIPINDRSFILARIPPPTYTQAQGIGLMERSDPFVSVSPNATSVWPRVPAATICPRCSALIITVVVVRRSTITHLTALTLFLLGCWPCCMIPYCMDSCNNTDHYCPICRAYLGTYTP
ncbi:PREDICTED: lipopolysaccharide-induced tumor necrosis factor-alpha factor homolog isoform X2 [Wasmannia auropunctata]|uniref:lipopolysaccharide-induced tumor necrosis factor-alpha factor homolog isoform X2 n=1 Tax=Wasmannia auropunctata TaxID=64793 RepID=UPI0005EE717D|nr:PREDICTED: lipopolysaccharide-induced tumor necrosis factor-alpha factor homolog isoform X2 [Wasmannia auropunctata]